MVLKQYTYHQSMTEPIDAKHEFSLFKNAPDIVYLDSASTTLVPRQAVQTTEKFLNSTVVSSRKGAYNLAVRGSAIVEETRKKLAAFLSVTSSDISYQKSISSAVASLAFGYDWKERKRDKIIIAQSEENSVYVSLLRTAQILDLEVQIIPIDGDGNLDLSHLETQVDDRTGIVAVSHVSPGIGTRNLLAPVSEITKEHDAILLTDATRSIGFTDTYPSTLGSDIVLFSGNLGLMGPPGLALQWVNGSTMKDHTPGILGGSAVSNVSKNSFELALQPDRYESGYLNVPAIAGLGSAIDYLTKARSQGMYSHIQNISRYFMKRMNELSGVEVYGKPTEKNTIFGFNVIADADISCHDVALFLDESGIAVRSGLICAHPLIQSIHTDGIVQVSIHAYNTLSDIDRLHDALNAILSELV